MRRMMNLVWMLSVLWYNVVGIVGVDYLTIELNRSKVHRLITMHAPPQQTVLTAKNKTFEFTHNL